MNGPFTFQAFQKVILQWDSGKQRMNCYNTLGNLERLLLGRSRQLTGCIPDGLQVVVDNDLGPLGRPFC